MKKLHTCAFLTAAIASLAMPLFGAADVSAASSVSYKDFSQLDTKLNNTYAYTKLYWQEDTTIKVVHAGGEATLGDTLRVGEYKQYNYLRPGETMSFLIENSTATDANGAKMDVLYKISDVHPWVSGENDTGNPKSWNGFAVETKTYGSDVDVHPTTDDERTQSRNIKAGDPIILWNQVTNSDALYSVKFCKKGTYNASSDDCTAAGINNVSAAFWDFDVLYSGEDETILSKPFAADEGIIFEEGNTTIYYNRNNPISDLTTEQSNNGYAIDTINGASFNGIYYGNSIFTTTTGLSNSTFKYRYTGTGYGIAVMFGSAVPYEIPKPVKTVDKAKAKKGETVTYKIKQEVPQNYSSDADVVTYMSLWSKYDNIAKAKNYTALRIVDSFDNNLIVPAASRIKITNESGADVTSLFTVTVSGQTVEATAKSTSLASADFYGHTYYVTVPTTVNNPVTTSPIANLARTIYTPTGGSDTTLTSDPVEVKIQHTVTVIYIDDETEEELADGYEKDYDHGARYDTEESDEIPDHYVLVADPDNASGTVNDDITVVYRYTPPYTVTVCWIDDETGKEFVECTEEEYGKGDEYTTNPLEENPKDYQLVGTPDNATGTVNGDVKVIYRYRKIKNPKTIDGSFGAFVVIAASSVAGFGLYFGLKQRR